MIARSLCAITTLLVGCSSAPDENDAEPRIVAVTFNTGTTKYASGSVFGPEQAAICDQYYGNGLSFVAIIEDTRRFFDLVQPDIVAFQEIFYSGECASIPAEARAGFVCETWKPGDPTVAQLAVGDGYQVACNPGNPDKCLAVSRAFGSFRGCTTDLCLDGLDGAPVAGCGSGSRIGRGVIDLAGGGSITVVNVHGTSGIAQQDQDCRLAQFRQVFVDFGLGDGAPAANGARNLILGDFNTDPYRNADFDESAQEINAHAGEGKPFHFVSSVGPDAEPSYGGFFNIDHVISDGFGGACWIAGQGERAPVTEIVSFDHLPVVCELSDL